MRRRHRGALEVCVGKRIGARRTRVSFEQVLVEGLLEDAGGYAALPLIAARGGEFNIGSGRRIVREIERPTDGADGYIAVVLRRGLCESILLVAVRAAVA